MPLKPWILRRIRRELDKYPFVLENNEETIRFQFGKYIIQVNELAGYPFSPPRITIDGKILSYASSSLFPSRLIGEYSKKYNCPCCVSITCPDNWSPSFGIIHILHEFVGFVEKLKTHQKIKIFQSVNLPEDMIYEITSFLQ